MNQGTFKTTASIGSTKGMGKSIFSFCHPLTQKRCGHMTVDMMLRLIMAARKVRASRDLTSGSGEALEAEEVDRVGSMAVRSQVGEDAAHQDRELEAVT